MIDIKDIKRKFYKEGFNVEDIEITKDIDVIFNEKNREGVKLIFEEKLGDSEQNVRKTRENLNLISETLNSNVDKLNFKINQAVEKLRGAILVERNTTSTIYSTIIPITKQQTNNITTTATISDNIIFGISDTVVDHETITPLVLSNISFKNLNIKSLNKKSTDLLQNFVMSNKTHNTLPFEFTIDVRGLLRGTTSIILSLKDYAIIEVYRDGGLFKEKALSNYFNIPVEVTTENITLRVYPTIHKSTDLYFDVIGITEYIYQNSTIYETKQIPVNKSLSNIVVDTCDNSNDININIDYYISVNGKEYEKFLPARKNNIKNVNNLQSIITLSKDSELNLVGFNGSKLKEGDIRYSLPSSLQNFLEYQTYVYIPNVENKNDIEFYLLVKEDITLHKDLLTNSEAIFYIDNIEQIEDTLFFSKGIRHLKVINNNGNIEPIDYGYLSLLIGEKNIYSNKVLKPILKTSGNIKYISFSTPEVLNYFNTTEPKEIFIKETKKEIAVNTIKLKAVLGSVDMKTVPYISRILIRGL